MKKKEIFLQKVWRKIGPFLIAMKNFFQVIWEKIDPFWILAAVLFFAIIVMGLIQAN